MEEEHKTKKNPPKQSFGFKELSFHISTLNDQFLLWSMGLSKKRGTKKSMNQATRRSPIQEGMDSKAQWLWRKMRISVSDCLPLFLSGPVHGHEVLFWIS